MEATMDFPSASTFGLLPSRRTAISLSVQVAEEWVRDEDLDIDLDELAELLDGSEDEVAFEIVFEPWDDELDAYVIGELDEDEDEDDEDDGFPC
jgi:hypothetical protein